MYPTDPFTILQPQDPGIRKLVRNSRSTDSNALKLWKGRSGSWVCMAIPSISHAADSRPLLDLVLFCSELVHSGGKLPFFNCPPSHMPPEIYIYIYIWPCRVICIYWPIRILTVRPTILGFHGLEIIRKKTMIAGFWGSNEKCSIRLYYPCAYPKEPFAIFKINRFLCSPETSIDGFWSTNIVKCSVGRYLDQGYSACNCCHILAGSLVCFELLSVSPRTSPEWRRGPGW